MKRKMLQTLHTGSCGTGQVYMQHAKKGKSSFTTRSPCRQKGMMDLWLSSNFNLFFLCYLMFLPDFLFCVQTFHKAKFRKYGGFVLLIHKHSENSAMYHNFSGVQILLLCKYIRSLCYLLSLFIDIPLCCKYNV